MYFLNSNSFNDYFMLRFQAMDARKQFLSLC